MLSCSQNEDAIPLKHILNNPRNHTSVCHQSKMFGTGCIPNHSHLLWLLHFWLTVLYAGITSGLLFRQSPGLRELPGNPSACFIEQYGMYKTLYFHCSYGQADGLWRGGARELSPTGTISMGNRARNGGQQLLWHVCAEIGFPRQLMSTREAELIRHCRPPVPYLNVD